MRPRTTDPSGARRRGSPVCRPLARSAAGRRCRQRARRRSCRGNARRRGWGETTRYPFAAIPPQGVGRPQAPGVGRWTRPLARRLLQQQHPRRTRCVSSNTSAPSGDKNSDGLGWLTPCKRRVTVVSPVTDSLRVAEALARDFAATAVERDRRGGTPKQERDALRSSGLLALSVPTELGGHGATWATT